MSESVIATLFIGIGAALILPVILTARAIELWLERRSAEKTPAE